MSKYKQYNPCYIVLLKMIWSNNKCENIRCHLHIADACASAYISTLYVSTWLQSIDTLHCCIPTNTQINKWAFNVPINPIDGYQLTAMLFAEIRISCSTLFSSIDWYGSDICLRQKQFFVDQKRIHFVLTLIFIQRENHRRGYSYFVIVVGLRSIFFSQTKIFIN